MGTYCTSCDTLPTIVGADHHFTQSINIGCNQCLSLVKIALKVPSTNRNHSLMVCTGRCGEYMSLVAPLEVAMLNSTTSFFGTPIFE